MRRKILADADALVREAGWNQTPDDWRAFLDFGTVYAIRDKGRVIATAATLPYGGKFAWISMVLIAGYYRRQGLGTKLMQRCLDDLLAANLVPVLDATPAGRDVYTGLGFEDSWSYKRLLLNDRKVVPELESDIAVEAISDSAWRQLCEYDASVFGADRSQILVALARPSAGSRILRLAGRAYCRIFAWPHGPQGRATWAPCCRK